MAEERHGSLDGLLGWDALSEVHRKRYYLFIFFNLLQRRVHSVFDIRKSVGDRRISKRKTQPAKVIPTPKRRKVKEESSKKSTKAKKPSTRASKKRTPQKIKTTDEEKKSTKKLKTTCQVVIEVPKKRRTSNRKSDQVVAVDKETLYPAESTSAKNPPTSPIVYEIAQEIFP